uniref:Elongation factor Ts, mitochondrial n=1 Tax=Chlamydomonas reinhardtii TaxID=3055 RepID=EFTS_CHLRE|nr:RecName: Full=Elongation factor Ts, mitochondrial; Short=EF-Ts; Short=EF-TsMt [Chlamydomonas reinhardtii]|eukprot:XP_001690410.1 elongation factor Ts-like protein [Chlamydomonas reinhardtii]
MSGIPRSLLGQCAVALLGANARSGLTLHHAFAAYSSAAAPAQSAALIKQLRERSGAPIADVKSMLVEHGWDMDKAYEALRKKGLAAAAKKASRHAAEGLVGASFAASAASSGGSSSSEASTSGGGRGSVVVVELNSETDFVARNELFQKLLREVMGAAHALGPAAALMSARTASGPSVSEAVTALAVQVRENVRLRRAFRVDSGAGGLVFPYVHQAAAPGLGKLASVVVLAPEPDDKAQPLVLDKVVEGRLGKLLSDWCLEAQRYVLEDELTVDKLMARLKKEVGQPVRVASFLRVQCGEGLGAKAGGGDFAAEVARIVSEA